jgi:spermidine/putrescine transport system substrate-binding protein
LLQRGVAGATAFLAATASSGSALAAVARPATRRVAAAGQEGGILHMASWIGYMDLDENNDFVSTLRFTQDTGIEFDYQEAVNDNEEFFASDLQGPLSAGVSTGWDIVVLTDWMIQRLANLGWLEAIDTPAMANYPANLAPLYRTRAWDPDNVLAAPWVGGMTGLGFDQTVTGELTSLDVLFGQDYAGRLTYLYEMRDTVGLSALRLGSDPTNLTQEGFDAALAEVKAAVDAGIVRRFTGNDYVQDMVNGDVVVAMAWSGDVVGMLVPSQLEGQDFQWRLADQGGMLWSDNMSIPKGAENKAQAERFIDWYYDPANAARIDAYVQYVCPVVGAAEAMAAIDPELAKNSLVFPTEDMTARLHQFISLDPDTAAAWEGAYAEVAGL